jgi:FlaA1/EpsC-like NDP-sugar epimerase
VAVRALL